MQSCVSNQESRYLNLSNSMPVIFENLTIPIRINLKAFHTQNTPVFIFKIIVLT